MIIRLYVRLYVELLCALPGVEDLPLAWLRPDPAVLHVGLSAPNQKTPRTLLEKDFSLRNGLGGDPYPVLNRFGSDSYLFFVMDPRSVRGSGASLFGLRTWVPRCLGSV